MTTRLNNLYRATGRYPEAEPLFKRAIAILEKTLPPDHPSRMRIWENYADFLDQLGRHGEAVKFRAQAPMIR